MRMSAGSPEYKDRLFSFVFGNEEHKEWTLSLYNAINGTHYDNPDEISIETIRQVLERAPLKDSCPPLSEYAWSVDSVRQYKKTDNLEAAIDRTLDTMPDSFLIKPFLEQHRAEVKNTSASPPFASS